MSGTTRNRKSNGRKPAGGVRTRLRRVPLSFARDGALGAVLLVIVLAALSALAGANLQGSDDRVYMQGEIAGSDVAADREVLVEDVQSTRAKRRQVAEAQPPVFELTGRAFESMENGVQWVFSILDAVTAESTEEVRWKIAERLNSEIDLQTMYLWRGSDFQALVKGWVLPWLEKYMSAGVVADSESLAGHESAIIRRSGENAVERLRTDIADVPDVEQMFEDLTATLKKDLGKPLAVRRGIVKLVRPLAEPSLYLDAAETERRKNDAMAAVDKVFYHIKKGEVVVRQGEVVGPEQQLKLQALVGERDDVFDIYRALGVFTVSVLFMVGLSMSARCGLFKPLSNRDVAFLSTVILVFGILAKFLALFRLPLAEGIDALQLEVLQYSLPLAGATGILALFYPYLVCFFAGLVLAFISTEMLGGGLPLFSFLFISAMIYAFLVRRAADRTQLMKSVLPLLGAMLLAWCGINFLEFQGLARAAAGGGYVMVGGLLSLFFVLGASPVAEFMFGFTSRFKLMELMNLEQPLLQELMVQAPGTYHHSLILSNLAEAGARAIGANSLLAKVGALYHDIGKLKAPHYFIENQYGRVNPHDKLAPSMSALILISHVKKGVELAREYKLGSEIEDLIRQHHGTTLISYFYHKAKDRSAEKEDVREQEYRYPGPRPQTREAGLLLLADAVEASARTLADPTPSRIRGHVDTIFRRIFSEGQLDECDLTLKDLHLLSEAYSRMLTGVFHQRIEYPGDSPGSRKAANGNGSAKPDDNVTVLPLGRRNGTRG